ncbi:MAG: hypothetical protein M1813_002225 [Trichoglossum hirsutum]|nr:MAG: hypothetical protein M1813_002225 [Trichoglossum hirsutum]
MTQTNDTTTEVFHSKYGDVTKLTTVNYHIWDLTLQYTLQAVQTWNMVTGAEQPPEASANIANANVALREYYKDKQTDYDARRAVDTGTPLNGSDTPSCFGSKY